MSKACSSTGNSTSA